MTKLPAVLAAMSLGLMVAVGCKNDDANTSAKMNDNGGGTAKPLEGNPGATTGPALGYPQSDPGGYHPQTDDGGRYHPSTMPAQSSH